MKKHIITLTLFLAVVSMQGQSLSFLNITSDAGMSAIGGASVAMKSDYAAIYNNPAAMSLSTRTLAVGASYGMWQPKVNNNTIMSFSGYYKIGERLGIGLGGRYFTFPEYNITDNTGYVKGTYSPKDYSVDLGVSYSIVSNLSVGATIRYISSDLGGTKAPNAIVADVAIMYKIKELNIALAATNLGTKINYGSADYSLPSMIKGGVSYCRDLSQKHNVTLSVEGDYLLYSSAFMAGLGVKYSYNDMISIGAGYHYGADDKAVPSCASVGMGFKLYGIAVNGSYLLPIGNDILKNTIMITLSYEL